MTYDLTQEEKEDIEKLINIEDFKANYNPESIDIVKQNVTVDTTNKNIKIQLRGTTNQEVAASEYKSDVTGTLKKSDIKIYIKESSSTYTDITNVLGNNITLETATTTTNSKTGAKDLLQVITLTGLEQLSLASGKSYKDWSGNIRVEVAQKSLSDSYGNKSVSITSAGARQNHFIEDTTLISKNTSGSMFGDVVGPAIIYKNSDSTIDKTNHKYTMIFDVTDKYYDTSNASLTTSDLGITIDGVTPDWNKVTRSLTSTNITATVDGVAGKTIGRRYTLVLSNLEQLEIATRK